MFQRILALILKELTSLWSDKKTRYVLLFPPLIQVLIFANAANFDVTRVPLGIWNEDQGAQSAELVRRFAGSSAFLPAAALSDPAGAQDALESKTVAAVLHIPQNFSAGVLARRNASVELLIDARRSNSALMVGDYAAEITAEYAAGLSGGARAPVDIEVRNLFNPTLESKWFILPGLVVVLSLMMTMLVSALSLARERELGTFEQMMVTPLRPGEIMFGKAVPALIVGMLEANIVLAAALLFYGVPFEGNLAVLEIATLVFSVAGVAIGLTISAFTQTQQQAILGVFIYSAPAIVISGYATPLENMPPAMQLLSLLDPIRYMLVITRGMFLQDLPMSVVVQQSWPMVAIAVILLAISTWTVRRAIA